MMHWKARRLLPSLLDGALARRVERRVRMHARECARCTRALRDFERSEDLLRQVPPALLPQDWSPAAESHLGALALWAAEPRIAAQDRLAMRAAAATATIAFLLFMVSVGPWSVVEQKRSTAWLLPSAERQSLFVAAAFEPKSWRASN